MLVEHMDTLQKAEEDAEGLDSTQSLSAREGCSEQEDMEASGIDDISDPGHVESDATYTDSSSDRKRFVMINLMDSFLCKHQGVRVRVKYCTRMFFLVILR